MKAPTDKLNRIFRDLEQHPSIMRKAITFALDDTAEGLRQAEVMEMEVVFKSPRKYTLGSLYAVKARGDNSLKAGLAWKEFGGSIPAYKYIAPNVFGGGRRMKRHELALQGKGILPEGSMTAQGRSYPKDDSGDITGGQYTRMLAELDALPNTPGGQKSKTKKRADSMRFFVYKPKGAQFPVGIAEPNGDGIRIMLRFIQPPTYKPIFDYYGVADDYVRINFPKQLERQWLKWQPLAGFNKSPFRLAA
jgi:hypothetical protein